MNTYEHTKSVNDAWIKKFKFKILPKTGETWRDGSGHDEACS